MDYTRALIASSLIDAPASSMADLLTLARASGVPASEAVADRLALRAVRADPTEAELAAAVESEDAATEASIAASGAFREAERARLTAEAKYIDSHKRLADLRRRAFDANLARQRPAVATALKSLPKRA